MQLKIKTLLLFAVMAIATNFAFAQKGEIAGKVIDKQSGRGVEYASVVLLNPVDSSMVHGIGAVSSANGDFSINAPYGSYLVRVSFMGYATYIHPAKVTISAKTPVIQLGKMVIAPSSAALDAVVITAQRSMVEYQLDKRVINVDKNIVAGGGTASDVLEQVSSVAIDNDGNVSLRGSTNVKVLINGRPSELLASDLPTLLEQIPASTVENVEVITNPSAKYDPEGMSGIINIKLKDRTAGALGLNGVVNVNVGAPLPFMVPTRSPLSSPPPWAILASTTPPRNTTYSSTLTPAYASAATRAAPISNTSPHQEILSPTTLSTSTALTLTAWVA